MPLALSPPYLYPARSRSDKGSFMCGGRLMSHQASSSPPFHPLPVPPACNAAFSTTRGLAAAAPAVSGCSGGSSDDASRGGAGATEDLRSREVRLLTGVAFGPAQQGLAPVVGCCHSSLDSRLQCVQA
jgi:hypothetical protein